MKKPSPLPPRPRRRWATLAAIVSVVAGGAYLACRGDAPSDGADAGASEVGRATSKAAPRSTEDSSEAAVDRDRSPHEVAVRVVADGQPISGARVQVVPLDAPHGAVAPDCACASPSDGGDDEGPASALDAECASCSDATDALFELAERGAGFLAAGEARTDADGVARFPVQGDADVAVWVEASGFRPATLVPGVGDPGVAPDQVELERSASMKVRVEDRDGELVKDVQLAAFCDTPFAPLGRLMKGPEQTLTELPTGGEVVLVARAPGYVTVQTGLEEGDEATVIVLDHPRKLVGRALHGDAPVAGATIRLAGESVDVQTTATTDEQGRFTFRDLAPGAYALSGDKGPLHGEQELQLGDGDPDAELALALAETAKLRGTVTDAQSGKPVPDAEVELRGTDDNYASTTTDERGQFTLAPAPGPYQLHVSDDGHLPSNAAVDLREGDARELDVALQPGLQLTGRVVDGQDHPIADAHVAVELADFGGGADDRRDTTTDAQGRFSVGGLTSGPHVLTVDADAHPALEQPLSLPADALTVRLADGASVEGLVQGPEGPVKGARVEIAGDRTSVLGSAVTDADGHYAITGLPPGPATAVAVASGLAASEPAPLALRDGARESLDLQLAPGLTLRGRVEDDRGRPVEDAMVEGYLEGSARAPMPGRNVSTSTQSDGTFELKGLREGSYKVFAYHDGLSQGPPVSAAAGSGEIVLKLLRTGKVTGHVATRSGAPLKRFMVEGQEFHTVDGAFTLRDVSTDSAEIIVEGAFPAVTVPVQVKPGESVDVGTVVVDDGASLTGTVLSLDGRPAPGVEVTALPPGYDSDLDDDGAQGDVSTQVLDSPRTTLTDAEGRFSFEHLRVGSYLVQAKAEGTTSAPVRAQTGQDVELTLQVGAALHGRALLADGTPLRDGAAIFVGGAVTQQARVVAGVFDLRGLPSGRGQLLVTGSASSQRATTVEEVTLSPGESRDVAVTLVAQLAK